MAIVLANIKRGRTPKVLVKFEPCQERGHYFLSWLKSRLPRLPRGRPWHKTLLADITYWPSFCNETKFIKDCPGRNKTNVGWKRCHAGLLPRIRAWLPPFVRSVRDGLICCLCKGKRSKCWGWARSTPRPSERRSPPTTQCCRPSRTPRRWTANGTWQEKWKELNSA